PSRNSRSGPRITPDQSYSNPWAVYTHPTWSNPPSAVAQSALGGAPPTSLSALLFHGRCQSPIRTSFSSVPSERTLLHGQQKPALILADSPSARAGRSRSSISAGESATASRNMSSSALQGMGPPASRPSRRSTHRSYFSLPPHRNWPSRETCSTFSP